MSLTFHNNRWPLLTDLLLEAGWKRAAAGTTADLSFVDDGKWQNEETTKLNGKVKFFSRMFTDLLANKRSCAISLRADGCIPEVMPPTFTEFKEWEAAVTCNHDTQNPLPIWFFKKMNSSNSKGISVTTTVEGGKQILSLDAAGKDGAAKNVLASTFDDAFIARMSKILAENGTPDVKTSALRIAFNEALVKDDTKLNKAMQGFIIQRGVERPLLIKEGRKFCLRIYVVAVVRPEIKSTITTTNTTNTNNTTTVTATTATSKNQSIKENDQNSDQKKQEKESAPATKPSQPVAAPSPSASKRELEVYVSPLEIARPQKSAFNASNTDPASHYEDSNTLYASISDGTCYPKERWENVQFPRIKEVVRRVMGEHSSTELIDGEKLLNTQQYKNHFRYSIKNKTNPKPKTLKSDEGRLAVMGWDFMLDENDKPWLIEINAICNLHHSKNSKVDIYNKTNLAKGLYDVVLNPVFNNVEVKDSEFLHRVL